MFTAMRSAPARIWKFRLLSSGTGRRRPNIVLTTPLACASASVLSNTSRISGSTGPIALTTRSAQSKYFRWRLTPHFFGGSLAISRTFEILSAILISFAGAEIVGACST